MTLFESLSAREKAETALIRRYVYLCMKLGDNIKAADVLFPHDERYHALSRGVWFGSREFQAIKFSLLEEHGAGHFLPTKEERLLTLHQLSMSPSTPSKEAITAQRLIAEMQGEVIKSIDKTVDDKRVVPNFVFTKYDDSAHAAE